VTNQNAQDENRYGDYASGLRVERTLAYLDSIPDARERIRECEIASEQARSIQSKIATIRRKAVYELTLRPGSSGESVAVELGVSPKAVSAAISEARKADLTLFREALGLYQSIAWTDLASPEIAAARSTRDVLFAARTILRAEVSRNLESESDETFEMLERAQQRARLLASAGKVEVPTSLWPRRPIGQTLPDYSNVPPRYLSLARALNALPQVIGWVSDSGLNDDWMMSWQIRPAEPYSTVFDAGPHRDGWATSEWLVWLLRDYERSGHAMNYYMSSPPPFLNEPGESLSFVVSFPKHSDQKLVDPDELAAWLKSTWDKTGYEDVAWPDEAAS
jgi:transposase-like protein